jgi:hypothetical protein
MRSGDPTALRASAKFLGDLFAGHTFASMRILEGSRQFIQAGQVGFC